MKHSKQRENPLHTAPRVALPKPSFKEKVWVVLARLIASPWMYPLFKNSFLGQCGYVGRLRRQGFEEQALAYLLGLLESKATHLSSEHWWYFMRLSIVIMQNSQMKGKFFNMNFVHYLLSMALMTTHPRYGFDAAYSFVGFALWSIQEGALVTAYTCTHLATLADPHWGYPLYLHGWTGLLGQGIDPLEDFTKAVQKDWSILHHMKQDPLLSQYPQLIEKLQKSLLVKNR